MTFLNKTYGEWDKVDKTLLVPIIYQGSDDEDDKMIPKNNNFNNDNSVVSDSNSDDKEAFLKPTLVWMCYVLLTYVPINI